MNQSTSRRAEGFQSQTADGSTPSVDAIYQVRFYGGPYVVNVPVTREGNIVDRREMLKVKIKSLAEESRIIRHAERRLKGGALRDELHLHRVVVVRNESRRTQLAYALVRGRRQQFWKPQDVDPALKMARKYGAEGVGADYAALLQSWAPEVAA